MHERRCQVVRVQRHRIVFAARRMLLPSFNYSTPQVPSNALVRATEMHSLLVQVPSAEEP